MSFATFIAGRITFKSKRTFSKLIVRVAIIGIMLGLGVMILSIAIIRGFKREIRAKVRGFSGDIQVVKFDNNYSYQNSPIDADSIFRKKAMALPFISHVAPVVTKPGIIKANDEIEGVVLKGVDKDYDWSYFKNVLVAGKTIDFSDSAKAMQQIMISSYTADRLKLKLGDHFVMYFVQDPPRKRPFKIVGIFNVGIEEVDKTFVIGSLSLIQRLNNWNPNQIGGYEINVRDFNALEESNKGLERVLPIKLKSYTVADSYPNIFEWLSLLDVNEQVMLVLMTMVAVINMISALLIMILERTATIGIFKAMGASNWNIQKIFLYNASYLVGLGLLFGNIFGLGIAWFQSATHTFTLDQASYYMTFVPIEVTWPDVLLLNIGTMVICLIVLIIPSRLVSSISPVKAIQYK